MFNINRKQVVSSNPTSKKFIASSSKLVSSKTKKKDFTSTSSIPVPGTQNTTVSENAITVDLEPLLTGIAPDAETRYFPRLYRDMYYYDPIAGSYADLMSMLPFSDFSLGGIRDRRVDTEYKENLERLNIKTLLPDIALDYITLGEHCSSLIFNQQTKKFVDLLPHAIENMDVDIVPFYSQDPIIRVQFPEDVKKFINSGSKRLERMKSMYGAGLFEKIASGSLELEPLSTLYVPRKTFSKPQRGVSAFRRILPIYLIEKNLYRGTIIESAKRQRGILHLTCGDGENWDPTIEDLNFVTDLFMNADSDPTGAILATKQGISAEELRNPQDFWKINEFWDSIVQHKLRAFGISEAFLSADASYSNADNALSVFIENIRTFREMMTRKIFYNRIFPLISLVNGFTINKSGKLVVRPEMFDNMEPEEAMYSLNDGSKLFIPTINWNKTLKPEGDSQYIEMLQSMSDKGVPIPIRLLASAAGITLEDLMSQQEEDIIMRKSLSEYVDKINALKPKPAPGESESSVIDQDIAATVFAAANPQSQSRSSVLSLGDAMGRIRNRVPLLNREFGEGLVAGETKTGKPKHVINQKKANENINRKIAKALIRRGTA